MQFAMINLLCINWLTNVFYMQIQNQLWTGKLLLVNKEKPLVEHLLPHLPATPEEKWVCHLDPKVYVLQFLLEDVSYLSVNKTSLSRTGVKIMSKVKRGF